MRTIRNVMSGCWEISIFDRIRDYFGFSHNAEFWPQVTFFNFGSTSIGGQEDRYRWATKEQVALGRARVLDIPEEHRPEEVLVFTRKGWRSFPPTIEDDLGIAEPGWPHGWQTYRLRDGGLVRATGLRHPQFARKADMSAAVSEILALPRPTAAQV